MKKVILALGILIGLSSASFAQDGDKAKRGGGKNKKERQMMKSEKSKLFENLTEEQRKAFETINADFDKEKGAIMKSRIAPAMQETKIKELEEKRQNDISNILTAEQKQKWDERKANMPKGKRPMMNRNRERPNGDSKYKLFSDFTEEQKKSFETINADFDKEKEAIMNSRIAPAMQETKMKELREKKHNDISNILTAEQKQKWEEKKADMPKGRNSMMGRNHSKLNSDRRMIGGRGGVWVMAGIEMTDKQKEEYKKIAEDYSKEIDSVSDKHKSDRQKIDIKQQEAIKKILTDDQKKVFEDNLKKREDARQERRNK